MIEWFPLIMGLACAGSLLTGMRRDGPKVLAYALLLTTLPAGKLLVDPSHHNLISLSCWLLLIATLAWITMDNLLQGNHRLSSTGSIAALILSIGVVQATLHPPLLMISVESWLLLLALVKFGALELKQRPGAGWMLVGLLGWVVTAVFNVINEPQGWYALAIVATITALIAFTLAARKQLHLYPWPNEQQTPPPKHA